MKNPIPAALLVLLLAAGANGEPLRWKEFAVPQQGFAISFPGDPQGQGQTVNARVGRLILHTWSCMQGQTSFGITCSEYPDGVLPAAGVDQVLDSARDGLVTGIQGKLISERRITLERNPGREIECRGGNGATGRFQLYVVKNRFYQLSAATLEGNRAASSITRFLNSFRLIAEPPPAESQTTETIQLSRSWA